MSRTRGLLAPLLLAVAATSWIACAVSVAGPPGGDAGGSLGGDAELSADAGGDAGAPADAEAALDASEPGADAAESGLDATQSGVDAEAGPDAAHSGDAQVLDAGAAGHDAGAAGHDAGAAGRDAGAKGDAGTAVEWGVTGGTGDDPDVVRTLFDDLGPQWGWFRMWLGFDDVPKSFSDLCDEYHARNIKVILTINPGNPATFDLATWDGTGWATRNKSALAGHVDILAVGNEWNFSTYRPAGYTDTNWHGDYVKYALKPLHDVLAGSVALASVPIADNYNPATYKAQYDLLKAANSQAHCEYVDMHPYSTGSNVAAVFTAMQYVHGLFGKPLIATEFNLVTSSSDAQWFANFPQHAANAEQVFSILSYYRIDPNSTSSKFTLLDANEQETSYCATVKQAAQ